MSQKFHNLEIPVGEELAEHLAWLMPNYSTYRILRKSVDARRSRSPHFVYSVEVFGPNETPTIDHFLLEKLARKPDLKPLIVGAGPAGLFCALRLVERGIPCTLIERGSEAPRRMLSINRFWRYGELDLNNNVCFGEGGAGLYSDGKLITRIKSPYIPYVIDRLIQFGAPEEIRYLSNPHVGSDRIRRVIPKLREFLRASGCDVQFDTSMTELITQGPKVIGVKTSSGVILSEAVVLAPGHSATDLLHRLWDQGVHMEGKSYALGLRIEHSQRLVNKIQFREHAENKALGAANYRLADHDEKTGIGVYSFCMCPGGYVLSSTTDPGTVVCNGMSNYHRNSPFANSAIVVSVDHHKQFGADVFGGMNFRAELEAKAYQAVVSAGGKKEIPAQSLTDFLEDKKTINCLPSSSLSGVIPANLSKMLPANITERLKTAIIKFDSKMRGFASEHAQLHGIESRTSCPLRITRDPNTLMSISHAGLYPTGEGAGYAGGITSAAVDGVRIAETIYEQFKS